MNNYHVLPCGTVIPPEGIEAWVKTPDGWQKRQIVAVVNDQLITDFKGTYGRWDEYTLTDPTKPKCRLVTPMELLGKFVHWSDVKIKNVICIDASIVQCGNYSHSIEILLKECKGYSDTPTSPLKSFWVEEV